MPADAAITRAGIVAPGYELRSRKGAVRVCAHDEDAVTLAVAAGRTVVDDDAGSVDGLFLALGNAPLSEGPTAQTIREALGLRPEVTTSLFAGDRLASVDALSAAIDAVTAGRVGRCLVIAAEGGGRSLSEPSAGAAAVLVEGQPGVAVRIGSGICDSHFEQWRSPAGTAQENDVRYVQELAVERLRTLRGTDGDDDWLVAGVAIKTVTAARAQGVAVAPSPWAECGSAAGLATVIATVQENQGGTILADSAGRAALIRVLPAERPVAVWQDLPSPVDGRGIEDSTPRLSIRAAAPLFRRQRGFLLRAEAAKCAACGFVAFPPDERPVCPDCGATAWEPYQLPRTGAIYTYTVNRFTPEGFPGVLVLAVAELEDGTKFWGPVSDVSPDDIRIGMPVELVLRRFTQDQGAIVYGQKLVPRTAAVPAAAARDEAA